MDDQLFTKEEQDMLDQINGLRKKLIEKLTGGTGDVIPAEASDKALLVNLINGAEAQTLTKVKLRAQNKSDQAIGNAAAFVARALINYRPGQNTSDAPRITEVPTSVPKVETVPGEMDIGVINLSEKDLVLPKED
jgi:hypothetical protein